MQLEVEHRFAPAQDLEALVWRRRDFRETSRLITLLTPDQGRVTVLGKGAHRPGSQCLGRIDFLNQVRVKMSGGNLPVLHRVKLTHEPRGLREPARFLGAAYLCELFDPTFLVGRSDPDLYQLLTGGLRLIERCPAAGRPQVLHGIELRYLAEQGLLPGLAGCARCDRSTGTLYARREGPGLVCETHRSGSTPAIPAAGLRWLQQLRASPGKGWAALPAAPRGIHQLLGAWVQGAAEAQLSSREAAFRA